MNKPKYSIEGHYHKFITSSINASINNIVYTSIFLNKQWQEKRAKESIGRLSGENNPNWAGGRRKQGVGYIGIYKPEHPYSNKKGYVMEHRLIMEKKIGRLLDPNETVHHVDFDRSNNKIDNLYLFPTMPKHSQYHFKLRNYVREELGMEIPKNIGGELNWFK